MSNKEFIDLPQDKQLDLIKEAFNYLCSQGLVPHGIQSGDDDTWDNYAPAIELASEWYQES